MKNNKSSSSRSKIERQDAVAVFDPARMAQLDKAANDVARQPETPKRDKQARRARRKREAYAATAVDAAAKHGAALPTQAQMLARSWRVEVVDTPEGAIAKPAYVVRFDANAPIGRLSRVGRPGDKPALERRHVRAAEQVCALYFASMLSSKLVGSYDGVVVQGGGGEKAHMIDVACDSWAKLDGAMRTLLAVERRVVMEVAVYETPIAALARQADVVHFAEPRKAAAAVVQTLRCGLERLADAWGIDVRSPHDAST